MNSLCVLFYLTLVIITTNGLESHVFGGNELPAYSHKYLVKFEIYFKGNTFESFCSGSIIGPNWIISAAHCFESSPKLTKVLHHNPEDSNMEVIATVKPSGITINPRYIKYDNSLKNFQNDLALLKTSRQIKFNEYVRPIKLAKRVPNNKQSAIVAGYGATEPDLLAPREGFVNVLLSASCQETIGTSMLCSYGNVYSGKGDSGGPLVSKNRLVGVVSAGEKETVEDGNEIWFSYYVNVARHLGWIEKNTSK